ncbi:MAG: PrsW family intramembrane metalloprotease [Ignavibacteriae bacterium]|nr:PrsW family intramembrane metalloprotease [Ignavibacteriota bacterium]
MILVGIGALLAFAPGVFWLWNFLQKDKAEPEPIHLLVRTFFYGMLSVIPAFLLEFPLDALSATLVAAPLVEELCKLLAVRLSVYNHVEFNEPMDGFIYSSAAALGFASLENALYVGSAIFDPAQTLGDVSMLFIVRGLISVPSHAIDSGMWGYALGLGKFSEKKKARLYLVEGYFISVGLHAGFNFLATMNLGWWLVQFVVSFAFPLLNKRTKHLATFTPFNEKAKKRLERGIVNDAPPPVLTRHERKKNIHSAKSGNGVVCKNCGRVFTSSPKYCLACLSPIDTKEE